MFGIYHIIQFSVGMSKIEIHSIELWDKSSYKMNIWIIAKMNPRKSANSSHLDNNYLSSYFINEQVQQQSLCYFYDKLSHRRWLSIQYPDLSIVSTVIQHIIHRDNSNVPVTSPWSLWCLHNELDPFPLYLPHRIMPDCHDPVIALCLAGHYHLLLKPATCP
jgi:hypothetical protein